MADTLPEVQTGYQTTLRTAGRAFAVMPALTKKTNDVVPDGRALRAERSREAIVRAIWELIGEGLLEPTTEQIAERAQVGIRTVFRHFSDMEGLFSAVDARVTEIAEPIVRGSSRGTSMEARARDMVERRAELFEVIAPYKRSANLKRRRFPYLEERHIHLVRGLRKDMLGRLPELDSAQQSVLQALELVTSFEAWDRLRVEQRLSRKRATAVVEQAVLSLLDTLGE